MDAEHYTYTTRRPKYLFQHMLLQTQSSLAEHLHYTFTRSFVCDTATLAERPRPVESSRVEPSRERLESVDTGGRQRIQLKFTQNNLQNLITTRNHRAFSFSTLR